MATSPDLKPRRSLDRSLRAFMQELVRSPSPDSACEQDDAWNSATGKLEKATPLPGEENKRKVTDAASPTDDAQSETSDGSCNSRSALTAPSDPATTRTYSTNLNHNQDSDGDSGIDSVERFSQRIGSTSSADTDACHELERRSTRDPVTSPSYIQQSNVDDSHLEESMRRSCRKILAALYGTQNHLDEKGAFRYRSLSMPSTADHTLSAKRLSVPTATIGAMHIQNILQCDQQSMHPKDENSDRAATRKLRRPLHSAMLKPTVSVQSDTLVHSTRNLEGLTCVSTSCDTARLNERYTTEQCSFRNLSKASTTIGDESQSRGGMSENCKASKEVDKRHSVTHRRSNLPLLSPNKLSSQQNIFLKDDTVYPPKGVPLSLPGNNLDQSALKQDEILRVYARPASVVPVTHNLTCSQSSGKQCRTQVQSRIPTAGVQGWNVRQHVPQLCNNRLPKNDASQLQAPVPRSYSTEAAIVSNPSSYAVNKYIGKHATDGLIKARINHNGSEASKKSSSMPALDQQRVAPVKGTQKVLQSGVEYAVVRKKQDQHLVLSSIPRITSTPCITTDEKEPPLPPKTFMHKSNFSLYRGSQSSCSLSTAASAPSSPSSLFDRMQGLGRSAKSALVKAFSTERIYRPQKTETAAARVHVNVDPQPQDKNDSSLVKGLKNRISLRRKSKRRPRQEATIQINTNESGSDPAWAGGEPTHVSGQLLQLNLDGSQVVELRRPPGRSFGFFLARGRIHTHHGVFVSRMHDAQTQQVLQGLLDIGDEILEVNGNDVRDADIMQVNALMANQNTLLLTVLPYICRKDI